MLESLANWFQKFMTAAPAEGALGDRGENVAAKYLRNLGYKILHRNFECKFGEVDIIARDGNTLVFVEVKTRKDGEDSPEPDEQVNINKQHQMSKVAEHYLSRYGIPQPASRFDVLAVIWPRNVEPIIRHTKDAFESTVERVDPRTIGK
jgi:putative endonuclease